MENKYGIVGIAHVGLPTNDLQKTVEFYKSLGFEVIMQSYNEKAGEKVAFLQIKNYCIETFEMGRRKCQTVHTNMLHLMWKTLKVCIRKSAMKNTQLLQTESKNCHFGKMV